MYFWAALLIRNAPRRCTPSTVSQSFSDILNSRLSRITPALLTSTTGGPRSAATLPTAASTWSAWLTSAPTAIAVPPASLMASTVPAQVAASRSSTATAIPSPPRRRAVAAPMPRAAPVTMATRCASCGICSLSLSAVVPACPHRGRVLFLAPRERGLGTGRGRLPVAGGDAVGPQFAVCQRPLVHLVRPIGEPQRARGGPQVPEREVLADPAPAVRLYCLVDDPFSGRGGENLDRLDLGVGALVADRVHQPGGLEDEQPGRLDPDARLRDPVLDHALLGQGPPERRALAHPAAHEFQGPLGRPDHPHAVVNPARSQPGLGYGEPIAFAADEVGRWHPGPGELDLGVATVGRVVVAEHGDSAPDGDTGGVPRHQDHRLLAVPVRLWLGLAHHDEDLAYGVHRPR